jgi:hypothetical protein
MFLITTVTHVLQKRDKMKSDKNEIAKYNFSSYLVEEVYVKQ